MGYNDYGRDHFGPANDNLTPEDTDATPTRIRHEIEDVGEWYESLKHFLFTFGDNMGADRNGWIKISAPSRQAARAAMWILHGAKWAFCYDEEALQPEYFPSGELAHFAYLPDENNALPVLLTKVPGYSPMTTAWVRREQQCQFLNI
jgi:hypothetical protein